MQTNSNHTLVFEYGHLNDSNVTPPHEAMLSEIRQIMQNHQALNRFGLTRIAPASKPEMVMNENCLPHQRLLITTPKAKTAVCPTKVLETQWRLDRPGMLKACETTCESRPNGNHGSIAHSGQQQ